MNIFKGLIYYSLFTFTFCSIDRILNKYYKGNYYLLHGISNMFITMASINDLKNGYLNLDNFINYPTNYYPAILTLYFIVIILLIILISYYLMIGYIIF